jgi:branched-chain amino acid transport system substrate-binding protein
MTALVLALGLSGCDQAVTPSPAPTGTVRIVSSLPTRGYAASQARQIEQAIQLAIEERRAIFGTLNVEYLPLSDSDPETGEWSREQELANAERAANDPSVIAYIGPYNSGAAMLSIPVTNRAGLLHVSPSATWPGLTQAGYNPGEPGIYYPTGLRNFISMMPDDSLQAKVAARWAELLDLQRIIILTDGSTYSSGLANSFEQHAASIVISKLTVDPLNLTGLSPQLAGSQALFYAPSSVQNAIALAHALRGTDIVIFSTDVALDPQFLDRASEEASRWHIISNSIPDPQLFLSNLGSNSPFKSSFERKYAETPGQFATNAYAITTQILSAVTSLNTTTPGAERNRAVVLRYVYDQETEGTTGPFIFTQDGRPTYSHMSGYSWRDGRFHLTKVFPASP